MSLSIYHFERRIQLALDLICRSEKFTPTNKEKLLGYATYLKATGRSLPWRDKLLRTLKRLAEFLGSIHFKEASGENMVDILAKVEGSDCTRRDFQEITKQFFA